MTVVPIRRQATGPWTLTHEVRPLPMNAYRRLSPFERARYDRSYRETFAWLAKEARVPRLEAITVTVAQTCKRLPFPDVGALYPTAKAAIDGLVDVHVIADDDPVHLVALTFVAAERGDRDRLLLIIEQHPQGDEP